ncbi:MAG TPA: hypothetical protein VLW53_22985 [Candidatus Eisenbacteria bacterium]|nr:hypothetical protein [Candidatus Eisenbacteria bacterium]
MGVLRASTALVAGVLGILLWQALAHVATPARGELTRPVPLDEVLASLALVLASLAVGIIVGAAVAWALTRLGDSVARSVLEALAWIAGMPWWALSPVALAALLVAVTRSSGPTSGLGAVFTLGGLAAVLVAAAVAERCEGRTRAGLAAAGRALAVITGGLVAVDALPGRPGVGSFAVQAVRGGGGDLAAAVTILLAAALTGQVVASLADHRRPARPAGPGPRDRRLRRAALVPLAVPAAMLLASAFATNPLTQHLDLQLASPSGSHPLGTDQIGRDVLARLLAGFRTDFLTALGGAALAAVAGGAWGSLAGRLRDHPSAAGRSLGEATLGPAAGFVVAPLLVGALVLGGVPSLPPALVIGILLVPRVALVVSERSALAWPTAVGLGLSCLGVALSLVIGLGALLIGSRPPGPSVGGVIADSILVVAVRPYAALAAALFALVGTAPILLAGLALQRRDRPGESLGVLVA